MQSINLFSSGLYEPGQRSCCEGSQIRTASFPLERQLIMTVRWGLPAYSQESLVACTFCFFSRRFESVWQYATTSLIIALMLFIHLSESRGFISLRNLTMLRFQHFQLQVGVKGQNIIREPPTAVHEMKSFPPWQINVLDVDKLLAADESVPNIRPLCLTVSDGGELQRGGCSVSVQHRSLHTIFRSTHPHTGKYPPWVPLLPTLSAPCPPSVCLN